MKPIKFRMKKTTSSKTNHKENVMETPEQTLSLKLPDIVLKHLRCYGIDPEWFATDVCTNYFRDMMGDESNFIATMQAWAEHKGLSLGDDYEQTVQPQTAAA